jgi:hypothetical protein
MCSTLLITNFMYTALPGNKIYVFHAHAQPLCSTLEREHKKAVTKEDHEDCYCSC